MTNEKKKTRIALKRRSVAPPPAVTMEIMLEEMRSEFKAVGEGHDLLNRRMDKLDAKIDGVRSELMGVITSVAFDLKGQITNVERGLAKVDAKIDGVESRLSVKMDGVAHELAAHRADTEAHAIAS